MEASICWEGDLKEMLDSLDSFCIMVTWNFNLIC